jgi:hypothetical protein
VAVCIKSRGQKIRKKILYIREDVKAFDISYNSGESNTVSLVVTEQRNYVPTKGYLLVSLDLDSLTLSNSVNLTQDMATQLL